MDNIIQVEKIRYAKIYVERTLLHDLMNNCPGKSENLKPKGSLRVFLLLCFLFRSSPQKLFSKVAALKFCKILLENLRWICFSCKAWTFMVFGKLPLAGVGAWFRDRVSFRVGGQFSSVTIVLEPTFIFIELCSMLSLGFWISYFSKYLRLIAVIKSSQRRCSIKNLFLKILQYSKESNFIKKRHQRRCFSVNITKFLRTPTLKVSAKGCFV